MSKAPAIPARTLREDLESISRLDALDSMLRVLARATGLRVAMVVRVQPDEWTCCAVLDEAGMGWKVGHQLDVATSY